jgi:hypothetical protein
MFAKLAQFRRAGLRHLMPAPSDVMHCNDNLPGFRHPAATGRRRSPTPALACHWVDRNGRLECRWQTESVDETSVEEPGGRHIRCPHASSFSAKAIGHARTGSGSGYATLLHRNSRRDLSWIAITARGPGSVERGSSGVARLSAAAIRQARDRHGRRT